MTAVSEQQSFLQPAASRPGRGGVRGHVLQVGDGRYRQIVCRYRDLSLVAPYDLVSPDLCIYSTKTSSLTALQDQNEGHTSDLQCFGQAQVNVVRRPGEPSGGLSMSTAGSSGSLCLNNRFAILLPGYWLERGMAVARDRVCLSV